MGKFITNVFTLVGILTVLAVLAITIAVGILWYQDRQWQANASKIKQDE